MNPENVAQIYLTAFIDELARSGVRHVCFAPGSRSAPLALLLAEHPAFKLWRHLDERSAAFFALGIGKTTGQPAVLLCTSGTAAAEFLPASVEAHLARVPLLVLTADRPPELRDFGAPQTIDQIKLYGPYAKWFVEMALPEATADVLRYARTVACRAVALTHSAPAGVVHLNFPFREPLVPQPIEISYADDDREAFAGRADGRPYAAVSVGPRAPASDAIELLAAQLAHVERGLVIAGPQADPDFPAAVATLGAALNYPILADPLSQVRCGPHDRANGIDAYDAFLRDAAIVEQLAPDLILRFGAMPTSKPVWLYLQHFPHARQIVIDDGGWPDPARLAADVIHADATKFCEALTPILPHSQTSSHWLNLWRDVSLHARRAIAAQLEGDDAFFEGRVFAELADCLPERASVWLSSSMPVRDADTFFPSDDRAIRFLANRGANGIDGVVSSALGAAAVSDEPVVLVIGDIAFYHDLNGLLAAKQYRLNATIILINNDGGGIFSFLPQAAHPEHFEQLFGTPHGLDFRHAAALYGVAFHRAESWDDFRARVSASVRGEGLAIVEIRTERQSNVTRHRQIWAAVSEALK
jgi:2-succinyl-5-enolpyruvyl-6-hydroxy-3-cyclohexene-1-carboxylate synthase